MNEAIYKIKEQTIKDIANAIRAKAGKNDLISPLDMAEEILNLPLGDIDFSQQTATEENVEEGYTFFNKYGLLSTGTGGGINFKVVGGTTQPTNPKENTIWVNTDIAIGEYVFSNQNPWLNKINLLDGLNLTNGFIENNGAIGAQSSPYYDVYTNDYIQVSQKSYAINYKIATTNQQWLGIAEYRSDKSFIQRIVAIDYVSGTSQTYEYRPSSADVAFVRLSWSTYGNGCITTMLEDDFVANIGNIWIKTGMNGNVEFNALKKNSIYIYPQSCKQWDGSQLVSKEVKVYKNNGWQALKFWFLQGSNQYNEATGGWTIIDAPNGAHQAATVDGNGITFTTSANISREIATVQPIDFTTIDTLYFSIPSITNSSGSTRTFSLGVNPTRVHSWTYNNAQGWVVEKFVQNPANATNLLYSLDTKGLSGNHYILAATHCAASTTLTLVIDEIYGV